MSLSYLLKFPSYPSLQYNLVCEEIVKICNETSDEAVDYGSPDIDAIPYTDSDNAWSTHGNDGQD